AEWGGRACRVAIVLNRRTRALILVLPLALGPARAMPLTTLAQGGSGGAVQATVLQILDRPELFIERRPARVKDVAHEPETISTRNTRAQLRFHTGAGARVNRQSRLKLGSGCLLLDQGQLLVSGRQNGCTRSMRVSVRGTNYILEAFENGDTAVTSLQGRLELVRLRNGEPTDQPPVLLESGQRLRLLQALDLTTVIPLTSQDYQAILEGPLFRGFEPRLPAQGALEDYLNANVPGVRLPRPKPRAGGGRLPFSFGFGFGFRDGGSQGGEGPRPGGSRRNGADLQEAYPNSR
ncbi:hypothetical protein IQ216_04505, partial [Cyanobium sp. LEGE 06143]|uniref:hypothetical protein n=1 Tax=Cyanobium sp. LEGE 06143 TaxID=945727 RepID=UPI0019FF8BA5